MLTFLHCFGKINNIVLRIAYCVFRIAYCVQRTTHACPERSRGDALRTTHHERRMMNRNFLFLILGVFSTQNLPLVGGHAPVSATCDISCTVVDIVEWSNDSFPAINLGNLTAEESQVQGSASLVLYTNKDVQIVVDNSDAAQLSKDSVHTLVTQYKLQYDGAGTDQTGGRTTGWTDYDHFLINGSQVIHVPGDGAVEVILSVRALGPPLGGTLKNTASAAVSGDYTARQALTVCWK